MVPCFHLFLPSLRLLAEHSTLAEHGTQGTGGESMQAALPLVACPEGRQPGGRALREWVASSWGWWMPGP